MIDKKAGEEMPLDEIKIIAESERLAAKQRSEAVECAKQIRSGAVEKGLANYESALASAHSEAEMIIAEASKTDGVEFDDIAQQKKQQEDRLRASATAKMEQAVHIIMEGVVSD